MNRYLVCSRFTFATVLCVMLVAGCASPGKVATDGTTALTTKYLSTSDVASIKKTILAVKQLRVSRPSRNEGSSGRIDSSVAKVDVGFRLPPVTGLNTKQVTV